MAESKLRELSTDFAVKIIKLRETIKGHYSLVNQLEGSATSIGANIHEANYAHRKPDFIAKLQIALKECYDTEDLCKEVLRCVFVRKLCCRGGDLPKTNENRQTGGKVATPTLKQGEISVVFCKTGASNNFRRIFLDKIKYLLFHLGGVCGRINYKKVFLSFDSQDVPLPLQWIASASKSPSD